MPSEPEELVRACYSNWSETYYDDYYGEQAPYPPVHRELVKRLLEEAGALSVLDAGCGPASFLRELVGTGLALHGFDLSPEMVEEARRVLGERGSVWEGSVLSAESFRGRYDAVLCVGVLPHVPEGDDERVLANLHDALNEGGLVAVEARNQLFSLFTLNRYTYEFFRDELVRPDDETVLAPLEQHLRMDLPPVRSGQAGAPGYDEVLSRTHNPLVLRRQVEAAGFRDVRTLFYHYHGLPPMYQSIDPAGFRRLSLAREDPRDWRGHFMASAFLLAGTRS